MLGMFFSNVFDAEVINDETEGDRSSFMREETWNALGLDVAGCFQVLDKAEVHTRPFKS